jgi:hypothetical protein
MAKRLEVVRTTPIDFDPSCAWNRRALSPDDEYANSGSGITLSRGSREKVKRVSFDLPRPTHGSEGVRRKTGTNQEMGDPAKPQEHTSNGCATETKPNRHFRWDQWTFAAKANGCNVVVTSRGITDTGEAVALPLQR